MRPVQLLFLLLATLLSTIACLAAEPQIGADLSFVPQLEQLGAQYRQNGNSEDVLTILRDAGHGIVRLRLWHSPTESWHSTTATLAYAERVAAAGFDLMLDFHYSDTWADPGHQTKPVAWSELKFAALVDSVYSYSYAVISRFADAGVVPSYVQVGNEIGVGLLWSDGRTGWPGSVWDTPQQWSQMTQLLAAGIAGVRDASPADEQPQIVLHVAEGGNNTICRWFYDNVVARGVDFDICGVSFYPWWHGPLTDLAMNLHDLAARYDKPVFVVEASYPWTLEGMDETGNFVWQVSQLVPGYTATPQGQLHYLQDLLGIVRSANGGLGGRGGALIYWEPAFLSVPGGPPNPYENLTLFDFDGDVLPGLAFAAPPANSRYETIQIVGDLNNWSLTQPAMTMVTEGVWEDTLSVAAGCSLMKFVTNGSWDQPLDFGSYAGEDLSCGVNPEGNLCLAAFPGTALGQIEFPNSGEYLFRFDERDWTYRIIELVTPASAERPPAAIDLELEAVPNPFNPHTEIRFTLPNGGSTQLTVHDTRGQVLVTLADQILEPGPHGVNWDGLDRQGRALASGIYFVRIECAEVVDSLKIVIVR